MKSCPFCGVADTQWSLSIGGQHCIRCLNCDAQGPSTNIRNLNLAIEKWDRRLKPLKKKKSEVKSEQ